MTDVTGDDEWATTGWDFCRVIIKPQKEKDYEYGLGTILVYHCYYVTD